MIEVKSLSSEESLQFNSTVGFFRWVKSLPLDGFRMFVQHNDRRLSPLSENVLKACKQNKESVLLVHKDGFVPVYTLTYE